VLCLGSGIWASQLGNSVGCSTGDYTNAVGYVTLAGKFTATANGALDSTCIDIIAGGAAEVCKIAVYSYDGTFTLIDYTAEFTPASGWTTEQRALTQSGSTVSGTVYWVALWAEVGHSGVCGFHYNGTGGDADSTYRYSAGYTTSFPTGFGFGDCLRDNRLSCGYIVYTPSGAANTRLEVQGAITIKGRVKCGD